MESSLQNGKKLRNGSKETKLNGVAREARNSNYPRKLSRKSTSIQVEPSVPKNRQEIVRWHGWGYQDSGFRKEDGKVTFIGERYEISGKELPYFDSYLFEKYGIVVDHDAESLMPPVPEDKDYPKTRFTTDLVKAIEDLGIEVSTDNFARYYRSRGQSYEDVWRFRIKAISRIPDAVAWPTCHEEVVELVKLAEEENFVIIPYGGGTSVAHALKCPEDEIRPILCLDTNLMNEILWVDTANMMVCAESGIIGQDLERELNKIGLTTGHEPDSIEFSTLGGWVSTRASGMKKNLYGNIEDMMLHVKMVTPRGVIDKNTKTARMSCGPDFNHIILGSEGNFGVVTEVVLKVRQFPECKVFDSIIFPNFEVGSQFMKEVSMRKWQPANIRLMDEEQFQIGWALRPKASYIMDLIEAAKFKYLEIFKGFDVKKICLCTIAHEGRRDEAYDQVNRVVRLAAEMGGVRAGATVGKRGYMMTYVVAYIRDIAMEVDIVAESLETTVPWDVVYEASVKIRKLVNVETKKVGAAKSLCMMRIAQTYDNSCCLYVYFSFSVKPDDDCLFMCEHINHKIKELVLKMGGSLSHHHGVGKMKSEFYPSFVSDAAVKAIKGVKQQLDPNNVFGARNFVNDYYDNTS